VVARKFLRVGENGPEEFDIEFLNVEFKNATLYAHRGDLNFQELKMRPQKLKPPFQAALVSWVELLKLSGRRWPFMYEDVKNIIALLPNQRNNVKILDFNAWPEHRQGK
jgi:hypothetical protein